MKILVIGDTHGKLDKVREIWPLLKDIDLILHTGDHKCDGDELASEFHVPVEAVQGNCDGGRDDFRIIETEFGRLLLTHGHDQNVSFSLDNLRYKALENNCRAAVFGHTHKGLIRDEGDMQFINPGSLSHPRDGSGGSYAIIRTSKERLDASVVYYNTVTGANKKSGQSGFMRNILNYCDRL